MCFIQKGLTNNLIFFLNKRISWWITLYKTRNYPLHTASVRSSPTAVKDVFTVSSSDDVTKKGRNSEARLFEMVYTTIPHQKLKDRLTSIIRNAFIFKNGNRRYKYLVLEHEETYFVKEHSDSKSKYTEDDIIKMLEFLVDNIFVVFAGKVFQQTVGIPMGTNCAPLLADIFLYSYEADFIQSMLSTGKKH